MLFKMKTNILKGMFMFFAKIRGKIRRAEVVINIAQLSIYPAAKKNEIYNFKIVCTENGDDFTS